MLFSTDLSCCLPHQSESRFRIQHPKSLRSLHTCGKQILGKRIPLFKNKRSMKNHLFPNVWFFNECQLEGCLCKFYLKCWQKITQQINLVLINGFSILIIIVYAYFYHSKQESHMFCVEFCFLLLFVCGFTNFYTVETSPLPVKGYT